MSDKPSNDNPVVVKTWAEFRKTGLFLVVNQLLHVFGWALVIIEDSDRNIQTIQPARVVFRGFAEYCQAEDHIKIANYLAENSKDLQTEANS